MGRAKGKFHRSVWVMLLALGSACAQPQAPAQSAAAVSAGDANELLNQLQQASQTALTNLSHLRVEKWKTDSNSKRQAQSDVESIQRNLQSAMPEILNQLRAQPDGLTQTVRVYRNVDALYDVFSSVTEAAGAFGSKDDFQSLQDDLGAIERARRTVADRMEKLAGAKEAELAQIKTALQQAQAAPAGPPKKVIVDDNEPPKKASSKKKAKPAKPASTGTSSGAAAASPQ
ncbi:MAG: hypothetical protein H0X25_04290 [Acidobacteriales bacterium]|nr:hypothetical protein [Terriglobales bacterium]